MMFRLLIIEAEGPHLTCILGPRQKNRNRQNHTLQIFGTILCKMQISRKIVLERRIANFLVAKPELPFGVKSVLGEIMLAKDPL